MTDLFLSPLLGDSLIAFPFDDSSILQKSDCNFFFGKLKMQGHFMTTYVAFLLSSVAYCVNRKTHTRQLINLP